ncbi:pilus assembly protein PilN [Anoxybacillus kestanbolensis]|uniref:Pilus assembly protein PilN n=1 Tax=Anoxybacillus kestanbolensis TaxID=227476 RepID=A0A1V3FVG8_9BACL|nr:PilN domain-containing protein [Anoxybacillus kestanbolensis]OOE05677.1 pilus assembly protein PilN [Anoxybacillus kestanbolensis]
MLVEINLLPKRERKSRLLPLLLIVAAVLLLVGATTFYFVIQHMEQQISQLKTELDQTKALRIAEEEKQSAGTSASVGAQLQEAIQWAEQYPVHTVALLHELIERLPERGFLMSVSYARDGAIQLTAQFDTTRESAAYLQALKEASFIADVKLTSLTATEGKSEEGTMPRYVGQFSIQLNMEEWKKQQGGRT